jgi:gluconate 2-dehydrogenase gamma chain
MNSATEKEMSDQDLMTRREAIRRTALALGIAITPSLLSGVMNAQTVSRTTVDAPTYLSSSQYGTVRAIAERIIPKTDTPGAIDVGVPAFVDLMYGKYLTEEEKRVFVAGLAEVEKLSAEQGQRNFAQLSSVQQDALLTQMARAAQEKEKTFFHLMKELTLLGYFTSEPVGKKVLHYDPIPGRFEGCIPLSEVGNVSWTR